MANIVYIQDAFDFFTYSAEFLLSEEVQLQINTEMSSFSEDIGSIAEVINFLTNISSLNGTISQGMMGLQNLFDAPRWRKTDPLKIALELTCFTEGNAKGDVYDKLMKLVYYSIPWKKGLVSTIMTLPGINLNTLSNYQLDKRPPENSMLSGTDITKLQQNSSLISLYIPGIIYLPNALVKQAQPTFSKEITNAGFPLWGKLSLEVWSLTPVTSELLDQTVTETMFDASFRV